MCGPSGTDQRQQTGGHTRKYAKHTQQGFMCLKSRLSLSVQEEAITVKIIRLFSNVSVYNSDISANVDITIILFIFRVSDLSMKLCVQASQKMYRYICLINYCKINKIMYNQPVQKIEIPCSIFFLFPSFEYMQAGLDEVFVHFLFLFKNHRFSINSSSISCCLNNL